MNLQDTDRQLIKDFNRNVEFIKAQTLKKKTWVPASVITDLTGWDAEKLRKMRDLGLIEKRIKTEGKTKNTYEYLLESLNPLFINQKTKTK